MTANRHPAALAPPHRPGAPVTAPHHAEPVEASSYRVAPPGAEAASGLVGRARSVLRAVATVSRRPCAGVKATATAAVLTYAVQMPAGVLVVTPGARVLAERATASALPTTAGVPAPAAAHRVS
ncbi:hypothetical protein ACH4KN_31535 [Streptomyces sp. NPDC017546]|uniref:hypothetical protein n=1 Tax=Streptomyces sp. NPDC017546 TaxID=3365001 RepID=UPI0037A7C08D